jgi:hypothetical protein
VPKLFWGYLGFQELFPGAKNDWWTLIVQVKLAVGNYYQRLRADCDSLTDATGAPLEAFHPLNHLAETGRPWGSW